MFLHLQYMVLQLLLQTTAVSSHSTWIDNIVGHSASLVSPLWKQRANMIRYDTIRDAILMCDHKLTKVSLIYSTETKTRK